MRRGAGAWGMSRRTSPPPHSAPSSNDIIGLKQLRTPSTPSRQQQVTSSAADRHPVIASTSGRMSPVDAYSRNGTASEASWGARGQNSRRAEPGTPEVASKGKARRQDDASDQEELLRGSGDIEGAFDDGWKEDQDEESAGLLDGRAKLSKDRRAPKRSVSLTSFTTGKTGRRQARRLAFTARDKEKSRFPANIVRNQKYNIASFLPLVLYEQFKFFFNLYFLLVALSQFVPALRIGFLATYIVPLAFVLAVTIGKEAYDDWQRYQRDNAANSTRYAVLDPVLARSAHSHHAASGGDEARTPTRSVPSSKIRVGDIIILEKDQRVPADVVLLRASDASGTCFVRTDQLDGETDWKLRVAVEKTQALESDGDLVNLQAEVYADPPIMDIHTFFGTITFDAGALPSDGLVVGDGDGRDSLDLEVASGAATVALTAENVLWANTVLAAGQAAGFVVYTGEETRAVMNTSHPHTKTGLLDLEINRLAKILCAVTFTLSVVLVALNGFRGSWYIYIFRFLILFSSIIPISLRVNLDMGKTVYAHQIMNDPEIPETIVRTSTLPEELGRIEYLLSDKTGTLTQNEMELRKLHMGTMAYSADSMDEVAHQLSTALGHDENLVAGDTKKSGTLATGAMLATRGRRDMSSRVRDVLIGLGLCHNVTPVTDDDGTVTYQASSPDEVAIVSYTESVGLKLVARDRTSVSLRAASGTELHYDILEVFPFTSESKRMGIIVRDRQTRDITFYQKGADVVMSPAVQFNDWLDEECGNMAREGLRTLVMARKRLSDDAYSAFERAYQTARTSLADRNEAMAAVLRQHLEHDLELLGVTGVEDKLQEDVKGTLELLRNAGLRIWMLTGDKIETATCIAISSKLVSRGQYIHQVSKLRHAESVKAELELLQSKPDCCLVIDGESLQLALSHFRNEFVEVATKLPVVVACRCSPTQKADIARLIRHFTKKRVCCIGDGGNDVSMIQAADVGVGIVGKEGRQASLAADFSINQFSYLTKLLLWHGRNSYKRSAKLSQFVIHRGLIISVIQAVFSAVLYFAPVAIYQGWLMVGYATVYTMAPVFSLVLDKDVNEDVALLYPELYKELTKGRSLSYKSFFTYFMSAVFQGGAIMILSLVLFESEFIHIVAISFTSLVLTELLMVALEVTTWHRYMIIAEVTTLFLYLASMMFLPEYFDLTFVLTVSFLWRVALITAVSSVPLYFAKALRSYFAPSSYAKLRDY